MNFKDPIDIALLEIFIFLLIQLVILLKKRVTNEKCITESVGVEIISKK